MAPRRISSDRADDDLARSLRAHRAAANVEQGSAAKAAGIGQATLSRAERGEGVLQPEKLTKLLDAYGVTEASERKRLLSLTRLKLDERVDARVVLQSGAHHTQRRIRDLEEDAELVRAYQPCSVFGVAQTADYMRVVFGGGTDDEEQVEKRVAERLRRRSLLDDPSRRWTLIHTEGALRWHLHSPGLMAAQMDDLMETSRRPNVRLGVVDWRSPAPFTVMNSYHIYDDHTVQVGTRDGTAFITGSDTVADYIELFTEIERLAVFGAEARSVLRRLADGYRSLEVGPSP